MQKSITKYYPENGGRVLILFLLFSLAIYQFISAGYNAFVIICLLPLLIPIVYVAFTWRMSFFWALIVINYFIMWFNKNEWLPHLGIPLSLYNELIEILLIAIAIIDARQTPHFERAGNLMLLTLCCWCVFCTLEMFNNTCNLGLDVSGWYTGARLMAFQLLFAYIVFVLYITTPERLATYLKIWAVLSLFSVYWVYKQIYIGMTPKESAWLWNSGATTHVLNGGTLIRWFSTHNDAASFGIYSAASAVVFFVVAIMSRINRDRIFYLVTGVLVTWGMFQSGTRTAIFCLIAGFMVFLILSKSVKIIVPSAIVGFIFLIILVFTDIGNGNQQIRRMRSAFNRNDASANVRDINQIAMQKYLRDAPFGIGLGARPDRVPANNKYSLLSRIPPDSEYVYIWIRTGVVGITIFLILTVIMFLGACRIVFFRIKCRSLVGVGAGLCGAFVAIQLGGYGNQILMQFPNCLVFYGGLSIVYVLPYIEPAWVEWEDKRIAAQEEKKRLKLEKKKLSRV